jgi:TetR/AcrR family transcriptional regulator, transcriptional repressor for nem operon
MSRRKEPLETRSAGGAGPARAKSKFQVRRERTYDDLLASASVTFAHKGYARTTIDDIVAGTPYTRGAFYFHFEGKRECFLDVIALRQSLRSNWTDVPYEMDPAATPIEEMMAVALRQMRSPDKGAPTLLLAMVDFFQAHRNDADITEVLTYIHRNWVWEIARFIEGLKEQGWITSNRSSKDIATHLFAVVEGLRVHQALYGLDVAPLMIPTILAIARL